MLLAVTGVAGKVGQGGAKIAQPLERFQSLENTAKARRLLGFEAQYSWRQTSGEEE